MKLLLHICCAPCLIYPLGRLRARGALVTGFFYNPNIEPADEYRARRETLEWYRSRVGLDVEYRDDRSEDAAGPGARRDAKRCVSCWKERLDVTARCARERGFDAFSTTLLVSPYQDHEALRAIGEDVAAETGCDFYYEDFRQGFRQARDEARSLGLYRQKYCGCIASLMERQCPKAT